MDLYLSFPDEAAAKAVLYTDVPVKFEPAADPMEPPVPTAWEARPNYANIDIIGIIYKPTGETTEQDGMAVPVMAPVEGYHVNVRVVDEDAEALQAFEVHPATPLRVWA
jgi:hypothetical protein